MVLREKKIAQLSKIGDLRLSPGGLPNACVLRVYEIPSSTILGIFNIGTQSITSNVAAAVAVGLAVDKCSRRSGETEKKNTRRSRTLSVRVTTLSVRVSGRSSVRSVGVSMMSKLHRSRYSAMRIQFPARSIPDV